MKTHELGEKTTRRAALGLIGSFAAVAVGAAKPMHEQTKLNADVDVLDYSYAEPSEKRLAEDETAPDINRVEVELTNHGEPFIPLFFTWDQRRKGRHKWMIEEGPVPLASDQPERYRIAALGEEGRMNAGSTTQLTVFEKGAQRWKSIQFTTKSRRGEVEL